MNLCDYGCGKEAQYTFKNGKMCCSSHQNKCDSFKKSITGKHNPFHGKQHSKETKKLWKKRKYATGKRNGMYGKTGSDNPFYKKTHTNKQKEKWKTDRNKKEYKHMMSNIMKDLWKEEWFFESHTKYTDIEITDLKKYYKAVGNYTRKSIRENYDVINPDNKIISYYDYHIDHKFSIINGFRLKIDPKIIGSVVNLQVLSMKKNLKKNHNSSLTLQELLDRFNNYETNI